MPLHEAMDSGNEALIQMIVENGGKLTWRKGSTEKKSAPAIVSFSGSTDMGVSRTGIMFDTMHL